MGVRGWADMEQNVPNEEPSKISLRKKAEEFVDRMPRYPFLNEVNREKMIQLFIEAINL